jgi:cell division protein ZapB
MEAELKSLEDKLAQIVSLCQQLRAENHRLRQDVASALNTNRQLEGKIGGAAARLEALLQKIPDDVT